MTTKPNHNQLVASEDNNLPDDELFCEENTNKNTVSGKKKRREKPSCFDRAVFMLGNRNYAVKEITDKLLTKGYSEEEIAEAIQNLQGLGYLNDKRFAYERIRTRAKYSRWGTQRIKQELKQKGLSENEIQTAIEEFESGEEEIFAGQAEIHDWQATANQLLIDKYGKNFAVGGGGDDYGDASGEGEVDSYASDDSGEQNQNQNNWEDRQAKYAKSNKEKTKRLNFLIRRGFTYEQAKTAVENLLAS